MNFKKLTAAALAFTMVFTANAFAADKTSDYEQDKIVITYDEAVQKAIDNTTSIAAIDEAVDLMEKNKEALFTSLEGYFPYVSSDVTVDSSIGSLLSSIGTIDSSTKSYRYKKQMLEETAELMVKNYFNTIVTSENALELTKESLQLKQEEYSQLVMKHNLGMLSDNELETAKNEITKMMSNVTTAELAIDSVYESLASTIGLSKYANFEIDYELEYEPFTMTTGLEGYINVKTESDPSVMVAKAKLEDAEYQKKISLYDTEPYSYLSKENNVNSADRDLGDTQKNLRTSIVSGYNSITQLESTRESLEAALADAQTAYETAKVKYELGNITELEYKQAELAVKSAENDILSNTSSHDILVFQFEHPYMLSSSSGSSSSSK